MVPIIVITVPLAAAIGEKLVIVGAGINVNPSKLAIPPGATKLTAPVAPVPTIATMDVEETTVKTSTAVPPRLMAVVPEKFVPNIDITSPFPAAIGEKVVMVGGGI